MTTHRPTPDHVVYVTNPSEDGGTAVLTNGTKVPNFKANISHYIPYGHIHVNPKHLVDVSTEYHRNRFDERCYTQYIHLSNGEKFSIAQGIDTDSKDIHNLPFA